MADDPNTKVLEWVGTARTAATECERPDLATRLGSAIARLQRPSTIVCVVGEFKQGKSSLVNAILGGVACPVDDDLATSAVTVVHGADQTQVHVRRRGEGGGTTVEKIKPDDIATYVTEAGNPGNERGVERVDIGLKHPLLTGGVTLVDTPGMGGIGAGVAAMTLGFVPFADALLFVTDASAELSRPEVDLLRQVSEMCPVVRLVLTKIDLYPAWKKVRDLNAGHLAREGIDVPIVAVSSAMRLAGGTRKDEAMVAESGVPALVAMLRDDAQGRVKHQLRGHALAAAGNVLDQLIAGYEADLSSLEDPARADDAMGALRDANERLERLRGAGARWTTVLGDRMGDVANRTAHGMRGAIRDVNRRCDERIDGLDKPDDWEVLARDLQTWVAESLSELLSAVDAGVEETRQAIAELLADEGTEVLPDAARRALGIDVADLWRAKAPEAKTLGQRAMTGLGVVRGAQGGMMMFGMLGRFLPGAAASILLSNPVTIGLGVVFAGHAIVEQRKRKVAALRTQAKQNVRQFLDDVQFEIGNEVSEIVRRAQRDVRDEFSARIAELQRTVTDAVARAKEHASASESERAARTKDVKHRIDVLKQLRSQEPASA